MKNPIFFSCMILCFSSCVNNYDIYTRSTSSSLPSQGTDTPIEVFYKGESGPQKEYIRLAPIEIQHLSGVSYAKLIGLGRDKARKMGADAIIVGDLQIHQKEELDEYDVGDLLVDLTETKEERESNEDENRYELISYKHLIVHPIKYASSAASYVGRLNEIRLFNDSTLSTIKASLDARSYVLQSPNSFSEWYLARSIEVMDYADRGSWKLRMMPDGRLEKSGYLNSSKSSHVRYLFHFAENSRKDRIEIKQRQSQKEEILNEFDEQGQLFKRNFVRGTRVYRYEQFEYIDGIRVGSTVFDSSHKELFSVVYTYHSEQSALENMKQSAF